jgi:antitoxin PrlF
MKTKAKKRLSKQQFSSRLTSKHQATIPKEIRKHLHLQYGDVITYEVLPDNTVMVRKASPLDLDYLQAINSTLNEWESEADEEAYKNL